MTQYTPEQEAAARPFIEGMIKLAEGFTRETGLILRVEIMPSQVGETTEKVQFGYVAEARIAGRMAVRA